MGRLGCNCGSIMSSVDCPSESIVHIFSEDEITQALAAEPSITLWDFSMKNRTYEYWYCKSCGRVHEVNVRQGLCVRIFCPETQAVEFPCTISSLADWKEFYVITDNELDEVTEKDFEFKLSDYLPLMQRRGMLSPDQKHALVFDNASGMTKRYFVE